MSFGFFSILSSNSLMFVLADVFFRPRILLKKLALANGNPFFKGLYDFLGKSVQNVKSRGKLHVVSYELLLRVS